MEGSTRMRDKGSRTIRISRVRSGEEGVQLFVEEMSVHGDYHGDLVH